MSDRFGRAAAAVSSGGGRPPRVPPAPSGPVEGKVTAVSAAGVKFTVADYDGGTHVFGPAPWHRGAAAGTDGGTYAPVPHTHKLTPPDVGQRCLVVFVGTGIERPWVIAWY